MTRFRKLTRESEENITADIKDVERMYGTDVANALLEYCRKFGKKPSQVMNDLTPDGNGEVEWDKFDRWLQNKKGIDFTGGFGDYDIDAEIEKQRKREEEMDVDADEFEDKMSKIRNGFSGKPKPKRRYVSRNRFKESGGEKDEYIGDIVKNLGEFVRNGNFVSNFKYDGDANFTFRTLGRKYKVTVEHIPDKRIFDDI